MRDVKRIRKSAIVITSHPEICLEGLRRSTKPTVNVKGRSTYPSEREALSEFPTAGNV
jgi:hypothetical protein